MDWLTFIAALVQALAWPVIVLVVFMALRGPLISLLPLLGHLKYKDLEIDFGRRLEEAAAEAAVLHVERGEDLAAPTDENLIRLAEASPRAAVLEAWIRVERAAVEAARRHNVTISSAQLRSPHQLIQFLEESGVIDARQAAVFHDLRGLRNSAAHATEFRPSPAAALEYIHLASTLERTLRQQSTP